MIVITGGKGFIGSYLYDYAVSRADNVIVIDNLMHPSPRASHIDFINLDLTQGMVELRDVEVIYHLAADISVTNSIKNPKFSYNNNVLSTMNVLEFARKYDVKVVFSSSSAVYGNLEFNGKITEDSPKRPASIYGMSKLHNEHMIELYHELYGIDYVILRYSNVYGPGADPEGGVVGKFITRMLRGDSVEIYGDPARDFVYVQDVAIITYAARWFSGIYNLGTGRAVRILDLFRMIAEELDYTREPIIKPFRQGEMRVNTLDNSKLISVFQSKLRELGWVDFVDIRTGLKQTIKYIKTSLNYR